MKVFYFHYNKPASKRAKKVQISVHYDKQCIIVDNVICNVQTFGKINKTQPYFVMKGKCESVDIIDGIATII